VPRRADGEFVPPDQEDWLLPFGSRNVRMIAKARGAVARPDHSSYAL